MRCAPETILKLGDRYLFEDEIIDLNNEIRTTILDGVMAIGSRGERVLALTELILDEIKQNKVMDNSTINDLVAFTNKWNDANYDLYVILNDDVTIAYNDDDNIESCIYIKFKYLLELNLTTESIELSLKYTMNINDNINDDFEVKNFTSLKFVLDTLTDICDTLSWVSMHFLSNFGRYELFDTPEEVKSVISNELPSQYQSNEILIMRDSYQKRSIKLFENIINDKNNILLEDFVITNKANELQKIVILITNNEKISNFSMNECIECIETIVDPINNNQMIVNQLSDLLNQPGKQYLKQSKLYDLQLIWLRNNGSNNTKSLILDVNQSFESQFSEQMILINELKNEINNKQNMELKIYVYNQNEIPNVNETITDDTNNHHRNSMNNMNIQLNWILLCLGFILCFIEYCIGLYYITYRINICIGFVLALTVMSTISKWILKHVIMTYAIDIIKSSKQLSMNNTKNEIINDDNTSIAVILVNLEYNYLIKLHLQIMIVAVVWYGPMIELFMYIYDLRILCIFDINDLESDNILLQITKRRNIQIQSILSNLNEKIFELPTNLNVSYISIDNNNKSLITEIILSEMLNKNSNTFKIFDSITRVEFDEKSNIIALLSLSAEILKLNKLISTKTLVEQLDLNTIINEHHKEVMKHAQMKQNDVLVLLASMTTEEIKHKMKSRNIETLAKIQVHQKDVLDHISNGINSEVTCLINEILNYYLAQNQGIILPINTIISVIKPIELLHKLTELKSSLNVLRIIISELSLNLDMLVILIVIKSLIDVMNYYNISCLKLLCVLCYNINFSKQFISSTGGSITILLFIFIVTLSIIMFVFERIYYMNNTYKLNENIIASLNIYGDELGELYSYIDYITLIGPKNDTIDMTLLPILFLLTLDETKCKQFNKAIEILKGLNEEYLLLNENENVNTMESINLLLAIRIDGNNIISNSMICINGIYCFM